MILVPTSMNSSFEANKEEKQKIVHGIRDSFVITQRGKNDRTKEFLTPQSSSVTCIDDTDDDCDFIINGSSGVSTEAKPQPRVEKSSTTSHRVHFDERRNQYFDSPTRKSEEKKKRRGGGRNGENKRRKERRRIK